MVAIVSLSPDLKGIKLKQGTVLVGKPLDHCLTVRGEHVGRDVNQFTVPVAQMPTYMLSTRQISVNRSAFGQMKEFNPKL
ncbi:hypothetical protein [Stieleria tagensis]|uniref:hypothetical protein n=1 Tax=Stieleria tagensis TaxID=2956795 RepID=UPI00209A6950|nr:hypothetical protein [Stieleria tagensis]